MAACALAFALSGNGAAEPTPAASELVETVQRRYDAVQDISARFEQEARIASIDKTERSTGRVRIKRPGRMRWEYDAPEPRVIALDGDTLRLYLPEDEQLQIAPLDAEVFPPTALDFLLGDGKLDESFAAERIEAPDREELGLRLRPRDSANFESLEIWVSPEDAELRASVVVDLFGNRTTVRFEELRENRGVDDETFTIEVPKGTEVIDLRTTDR